MEMAFWSTDTSKTDSKNQALMKQIPIYYDLESVSLHVCL